MLIHGIVVCRNDWGMLALSITNVLANHADVVHVLNHGSSDQTAHGLKILQELWGERLKIYSTRESLPFNQSLLTNIVVSIAENEGADWIYVFDSDEFLLSKKNFSLQHELSKLNEDVIGARYSISNYISTFDFDKNNINHYKRLIYKSSPSIKYDALHAKELIRAGELTFFDVPFPSKMVFRTKKNLLINRGAHMPRYKFEKQTVVNIDLAECAHLSLISKDTLTRKSSMGKYWIERGDPKSRGWQNQLIYELDVEGKLNWFWEKHSIQVNKLTPDNPKHVVDDLLVTSLIDSIALLKEKFGGDNLSMLFGVPLRTGYAKETNFTFASVFQMCEFFDRKIDLFLRLNDRR